MGTWELITSTYETAGGRAVTAQGESQDFGSKVVEYTKQGRFDDAIQVCLQALQNGPSDEGVYQQMAVVYLIRAGKEPDKRDSGLKRLFPILRKRYHSTPRIGMSQVLFVSGSAFFRVGWRLLHRQEMHVLRKGEKAS